MNKKLSIIFDYLKELFPSPETELHYSTPFQFVVAVMLSAQATDVQVNKITKNLFRTIKKPEDLVRMGLENFQNAISSINYYKTKAKNIFATAKILVNNVCHSDQILATFQQGSDEISVRFWPQHLTPEGGDGVRNSRKYYIDGIPDTVEELVKLPGIGVKTAKLIAHVLYDKPFIAVDTHIHRVSKRLGIVKTKTPEQTSEQLEKLIPNTYKDFAHHALVLFGRYHCKAVKPKCEICKLQKICLYYKGLKKSIVT